VTARRFLAGPSNSLTAEGDEPMLRVYFTGDDVARTRIAHQLDPLWELVLAVQMLRSQPGDLFFTQWRAQAGRGLRRARLGARLELLLALIPRIGYFPDFLNPCDAERGLEHGLEAIRATAGPTLRSDIEHLAKTRRLPPSARPIAAGEPGAIIELTDTMRTCYNLTVLPFRRAMQTAWDRDRRVRTEALADRGVRGLFASLGPLVTWSDGELRAAGHRDQELHLDGRGLLLVPSYFCVRTPVTLFDPARPPVLIYPLRQDLDTLLGTREHAANTALTALIGATRATVLDTIATHTAITTTELARRLAISPASASEHAAVLRDANLITSNRDRNRVLHQPTSLGHALLGDQAR
jgi:DNA-binding transcriptional ArsR family regulator